MSSTPGSELTNEGAAKECKKQSASGCCIPKDVAWASFTEMARDVLLNLAQGFPDFSCPNYMKEFLCKAAMNDDVTLHQYVRSEGHRRLVKVLAKVYSPLMSHDIDAITNIVITPGGLGGLFCCLSAMTKPGDEVIIIEPFFGLYKDLINNAGLVPVHVSLRPPEHDGGEIHSNDFTLDPVELESKFSPKTKLVIFNTPSNPLGKVYTREETIMIADLCKKYDVMCISDEVYEWLTYDETAQHIRMATLPGMWERTVTVGTAGKTFGVTGWKIGWVIGPQGLIKQMGKVGKYIWGTLSGILQEAIAEAFELESSRLDDPECYLKSLARQMSPKRHVIASLLRQVGLIPIIPSGGYFVMCDISKANFPRNASSGMSLDLQFLKWMAQEKSVAAMPGTAFYGPDSSLGCNYIRFCFFKSDATLEKFAKVIAEWKETL